MAPWKLAADCATIGEGLPHRKLKSRADLSDAFPFASHIPGLGRRLISPGP